MNLYQELKRKYSDRPHVSKLIEDISCEAMDSINMQALAEYHECEYIGRYVSEYGNRNYKFKHLSDDKEEEMIHDCQIIYEELFKNIINERYPYLLK